MMKINGFTKQMRVKLTTSRSSPISLCSAIEEHNNIVSKKGYICFLISYQNY